MRFTYWVAKSLIDGDAYTIRGKIRQVVEDRLKEVDAADYGPPRMVTTPEFSGSFDMLEQCLGEGGAWWENEEQVPD